MAVDDAKIKAQVRHFYDRVGWQQEGGGLYQNARYEDLRAVSSEYIHRCHLRVGRYLLPEGKFLLDAGSGPVQYPEYLTYSSGYTYRVCLDLSIVALIEARMRIGEHGLFVVADVANLPFRSEAFDGIVSLHTLHHLPAVDHKRAYEDFFRTLKMGANMVVVNGWTVSPLMRLFKPLMNGMDRLGRLLSRRSIRLEGPPEEKQEKPTSEKPTGTYVKKMDAETLKRELAGMNVEIRAWRSLSVRFLRSVIKEKLGGRLVLKAVFRLEEWFPHFFGRVGQYPLVIIRKG
jgi:ubiquinone/menaquinone biosynthesis C-methylase UbiE